MDRTADESDDAIRETYLRAWEAVATGGSASEEMLGPLALVYRDVLHGVVHPAHLDDYLRQNPRDWRFTPEFVNHSFSTVVQFLNWNRMPDAAALAQVLFSLSVALDIDKEDVRSRDATRAAIVTTIRVLDADHFDVPVFRQWAVRSERQLAIERNASDGSARGRARLAASLRYDGQLRQAIVGHDLDYWGETGGWAVTLEARAGDLPDDYRRDDYWLTDARWQLEVAADRFREAYSYEDNAQTRIRDLTDRAKALRTLSEASLDDKLRHEISVVAGELREAARELDPGDLVTIFDTETELIRYGALGPADTMVGGHSVRGVRQKLGPFYASQRALIRLTLVNDMWGPNHAAEIWRNIYRRELTIAEMQGEAEDWQGWVSLLAHVLDDGRISCVDHYMGPAEAEAIIASCATDEQKVISAVHLALHAQFVNPTATDVIGAHVPTADADDLVRLIHLYGRAVVYWRFVGVLAAAEGWESVGEVGRLALRNALDAGIEGTVQDILVTATRIPSALPAKRAQRVVLEMVGSLAPRIDMAGSEHVRRLLREVGRASTAVGDSDTPDHVGPQAFMAHTWAFKAPALAAAVVAPGRIELDGPSMHALRLAEERDVADAYAKELHHFDEDPAVDDELRALATYRQDERAAGASAVDRLANARTLFEGHLLRLHPSGIATEEIGGGSDISTYARAVDDQTAGGTVFLDLTSGMGDDKSDCLFTTVIAQTIGSGGAYWALQDVLTLPSAEAEIVANDGIATLRLHAAAREIANARAQLRANVGLGVATRTAVDALTDLANKYLGPKIIDFLDARNTGGCWHLCVMPTGPFAFAPVHLLMPHRGHPLADDWVVSTLPSPRLLEPRTASRPGTGTVIAASTEGGMRFGLDERAELLDQSEAVAAASNGFVIQAGTVTPAAVLDAAENARYVHIAAHGSDYPRAPSFQCLYLDGAEAEEGRLFAHEIVRRDLSGVDLVTLSACETALGRIDLNDNMYGISAAFLRAGARAVVSALWPVTSAVSHTFFVALYEQLRRQILPLNAFRHAQLVARAEHPAYREWGAFVFMGDWNGRKEI